MYRLTTFQLTIQGTQNGIAQSYALQNLLSDNSGKSPDFNFRYFQSFGLRFVIPEGYVPSALKIQVIPSTRGYKSIEKTLTWSELLNSEASN